jgi:hypothetical protein
LVLGWIGPEKMLTLEAPVRADAIDFATTVAIAANPGRQYAHRHTDAFFAGTFALTGIIGALLCF